MIPENLLIDFGAVQTTFKKGELLFREGEQPHFYFQVVSGEVKMNNYNDEGKEFIQNIFTSQQSFAEPPLFTETTYPANAEAITVVPYLNSLKSPLNLLEKHPKIHMQITRTLANRLHFKAIMASEISSQDPRHRILRLLDYLKQSVLKNKTPFSFQVDLTRQQLADLTGLRVETVIRVIKDLEKKGELKIKNRKVYR